MNKKRIVETLNVLMTAFGAVFCVISGYSVAHQDMIPAILFLVVGALMLSVHFEVTEGDVREE
jgi:hypothetical protein